MQAEALLPRKWLNMACWCEQGIDLFFLPYFCVQPLLFWLNCFYLSL